jgi:hypothetical protein
VTDAQAEVFRRQAAHFTLLGSPLYHGNWVDWLEA